VAVVQVVGVSFVQHRGMAAIGSVLVGVISVDLVLQTRLGHLSYPLSIALPAGRLSPAEPVSHLRNTAYEPEMAGRVIP